MIGGLDSYLEDNTTKPSQTCADMLRASATHDWDTVYEEKKTMYLLKKEMGAGFLEGTH